MLKQIESRSENIIQHIHIMLSILQVLSLSEVSDPHPTFPRKYPTFTPSFIYFDVLTLYNLYGSLNTPTFAGPVLRLVYLRSTKWHKSVSQDSKV